MIHVSRPADILTSEYLFFSKFKNENITTCRPFVYQFATILLSFERHQRMHVKLNSKNKDIRPCGHLNNRAKDIDSAGVWNGHKNE